MSDEYELADIASYLEVPAEEWFYWTETKRAHYISKFNEFSVEDHAKGKTFPKLKSSMEIRRGWSSKNNPKMTLILSMIQSYRRD